MPLQKIKANKLVYFRGQKGFHKAESVVHLCYHSDKVSSGELVVQRFSGSDAQDSTVTIDGELSAGCRLQTK